MLESAYGTGPVYSQPAVDDYGYGDPGYADPSYEGPRTPYGSPAFDGPAHGAPRNAAPPRASGGSGYRPPEPGVPGYQVPEIRDSARPGYASPGYQPQGYVPPSGGQEIWPVTGAQEALPDTGPQPIAPPVTDAWGSRGSGGFPQAGSPAYPDQWYDNPRLNDQPRPGGSRLDGPPAGARPADPRLEGMNYGELRYDDPTHTPGEPGYDEPLDDESWYEELRRSAPAYPRASARSTPAAPTAGWIPRLPATASSPASRRRLTGRPATASRAATGAALRRRLPRAPR